jgi:hypothetical protein
MPALTTLGLKASVVPVESSTASTPAAAAAQDRAQVPWIANAIHDQEKINRDWQVHLFERNDRQDALRGLGVTGSSHHLRGDIFSRHVVRDETLNKILSTVVQALGIQDQDH